MVDSAVKYKCEECELKEAVLYCSSCTIDQGGELNHGATCEQDVYFLHPFCTVQKKVSWPTLLHILFLLQRIHFYIARSVLTPVTKVENAAIHYIQ